MEAIIYICHGSRLKEAREQAAEFINKCMGQSLAPIQEFCFLELAEPTIEQAFRTCVARGATVINAIPVLLLTAAHAKEDIPHELSRLGRMFPGVEIRIGRPIGVHASVSGILKERILETGEALTSDSMVLLVGRGSSDPCVKDDLDKIAEMFRWDFNIARVDTCFLAAAAPCFEEALQCAVASGNKKVFVIPYLLFTGILMKKIEKTITYFQTQTSQDILLCRYLGYHPLLINILQERVVETMSSGGRIEEKP